MEPRLQHATREHAARLRAAAHHETRAINDDEYRAALAEPIDGKERSAEAASKRVCRRDGARRMVALFGAAATTAGLKVTATIDTACGAANRAIRAT